MPRKRARISPVSASKRKPTRGSWRKGIPSPNPKGRPKVPEDYKRAIAGMGPRAMQALSDILTNKEHPRHEQASEYIVNRWKGMPRARTEISGAPPNPDGTPAPPVGVTVGVSHTPTSDEMRRRLAKLYAEAAARAATAVGEAVSGGPSPSDDDAE